MWAILTAAESGDAELVRSLLADDPSLARAEYWYTPPLHFAVREGHTEIVRLLLAGGADVTASAIDGEDLATMARDRGHHGVLRQLEASRALVERVRPSPVADHRIHGLAAEDDVDGVRAILDAQPELVNAANRAGGTPLHVAAANSAMRVAKLLLDRDARIDGLHGAGPGSAEGYAPPDFQPIDHALWANAFWNTRGDFEMARLLIARGVQRDLVLDAALGEFDLVRERLDQHPECVHASRPSGKRALAAAIEFDHVDIARLLIQSGADPNGAEGVNAPQGAALHAAARLGHIDLVEQLLDHGANPRSEIDSSGSAAYIAKTREIRSLLVSRGARLDAADFVWLGDDEEALKRVVADPSSANAGCGGVFAAACKLGKRDLLEGALKAGARVPSVLTGCRSYLLSDPSMLRLLLESGMDPSLPNWLNSTLLHETCALDGRGQPRSKRIECATILVNAGASMTVRDEDHRSTPLAWAARFGLQDMVEHLLALGSPTELEADETWATPLSWADRRGHRDIARVLRDAGARA